MADDPLAAYPISFFNFEWESSNRITDDTGNRPTYVRSGYAAQLLHSVLKTSGFREVTSYHGTNLILGLPSDSVRSQLRPFQRVSHYERTFSLGSKAGYHKLMRKFAQRVSPDEIWFYPESYLLP
jgi:hypothetical protein